MMQKTKTRMKGVNAYFHTGGSYAEIVTQLLELLPRLELQTIAHRSQDYENAQRN
jgi:hypothetical protein